MTKYIWAFLLFLLFSSCKSVSISLIDKGSTPEEWKTFSIKTLDSRAPNCPLNFPVLLSESLKDGIQNNSRLALNTETGEGEVYIEGTITEYSVMPIAIQNNNNAAQNRLNMAVQFTIFITSPKSDEIAFKATRFVDFDSGTNLSDIESSLFNEISEQIVQDVINKLLSNW